MKLKQVKVKLTRDKDNNLENIRIIHKVSITRPDMLLIKKMAQNLKMEAFTEEEIDRCEKMVSGLWSFSMEIP